MTSFKDFLEDIKLGHYWHMFEEEGYDDLGFILGFDDKDVAEMLNNVGIHKQGHRKKLESALKIRKSLLSESRKKEQENVKEKEPRKRESELNFHSMRSAAFKFLFLFYKAGIICCK